VIQIKNKNNVANITNNTDAHSFLPKALTPMRPRCARYRAENISREDYPFTHQRRLAATARSFGGWRWREGALLSFAEPGNAGSTNPLEVVQAIAIENGWSFEDTGGDEILLMVRGTCTEYRVFFTWMRSLEVFHLACVFELNVPEPRGAELQQLIASINELLWFGHFDLWTSDGTVVFRQALLLVGGIPASARQCEVMLGSALDICERYFPAFQYVLANRSANEAIAAVTFATAGEA
jgi:hypothetical protein